MCVVLLASIAAIAVVVPRLGAVVVFTYWRWRWGLYRTALGFRPVLLFTILNNALAAWVGHANRSTRLFDPLSTIRQGRGDGKNRKCSTAGIFWRWIRYFLERSLRVCVVYADGLEGKPECAIVGARLETNGVTKDVVNVDVLWTIEGLVSSLSYTG